MTARAYAAECLSYRTAGLIDAALEASAKDGASIAKAFEEFAIEASICKVACTETLDFVLDENVQIHGGNGFVRDYMAERYFRDARVNRIFEGTNEINRLLIPGMLVRRGLKRRAAAGAGGQAAAGRDPVAWRRGPAADGDAPLASEQRTVGRLQAGGADGDRHGAADLRRHAREPAGGAELRRRHPDRDLRQRERAVARAPVARCGRAPGGPSRVGDARLRARRGGARGGVGKDGAGGDGRRRHSCGRCWPRCAAC